MQDLKSSDVKMVSGGLLLEVAVAIGIGVAMLAYQVGHDLAENDNLQCKAPK